MLHLELKEGSYIDSTTVFLAMELAADPPNNFQNAVINNLDNDNYIQTKYVPTTDLETIDGTHISGIGHEILGKRAYLYYINN